MKNKLVIFGIAFVIGCTLLFLLGKTISTMRIIMLIFGICVGMYIYNWIMGNKSE